MNDIRHVGLLLPLYFHHFSHGAVAGMVGYAASHPHLHFVDLRYGAVAEIPERLAGGRWDGLITRLDRDDYLRVRQALPRRKPMVNIHPDLLAPRIPSVGLDMRLAAREVFAYFRSSGYAQVAVFGKRDTMMFEVLAAEASARHPGRSFGLDHRVSIHSETSAFPPPNRSVDRWLRRLPKPVGVLTTGGYSAAYLVRTALRLGYAVPDEVAVLSATDDEICLFADPPISALDNLAERIGARALAMLDRTFAGEAHPRGLTAMQVPPVIERKSTGVPTGVDPLIRDAMLFIRARACEGIGVRDVLRSVPGLSRTRLYEQFARYFGRSPAAEMTRLRLEAAKHLLEATNLPVGEVALRAGFSSQAYLTDAFRAKLGLSPSAWRKQRGGGA